MSPWGFLNSSACCRLRTCIGGAYRQPGRKWPRRPHGCLWKGCLVPYPWAEYMLSMLSKWMPILVQVCYRHGTTHVGEEQPHNKNNCYSCTAIQRKRFGICHRLPWNVPSWRIGKTWSSHAACYMEFTFECGGAKTRLCVSQATLRLLSYIYNYPIINESEC